MQRSRRSGAPGQLSRSYQEMKQLSLQQIGCSGYPRTSVDAARVLYALVACCSVAGMGLSATPDDPGTSWRPYAADWKASLEARHSAMSRYNYAYNKSGIDRRSELTPAEFRDIYDSKWPVLITDVVPRWRASRWDSEFFSESFSFETFFVKKSLDGSLRNVEGQPLLLAEFLNQRLSNSQQPWMYIEDEHFILQHPQLLADIGNCNLLDDDMFRLFPSDKRPWHAMLLWGTPHSRSRLHVDPYNWTGTNAVIQGKKRWKIFTPNQDTLLQLTVGKSGFPLNSLQYSSNIDAFDASDFNVQRLLSATNFVEFDQVPGELLIIPSGWPHQAYNVEETIAISSQVMNENNYVAVLEEIFKWGHLARDVLPQGFFSLQPEDQVKQILSLIHTQQTGAPARLQQAVERTPTTHPTAQCTLGRQIVSACAIGTDCCKVGGEL